MIERYDVMYAKENKGGNTFWNKCGVAFLSKNGSGYNLILDAIPAPQEGAYKLFLFEPKDKATSSVSTTSRPAKPDFQEKPDDDIPF